MRGELMPRAPEPIAAVGKHPVAGVIGGLGMALVCGMIAAAVATPPVAVLMALIGLAVGAPGGAHIAESAETDWRI
jgi:hypothetical protein